MSRLLTISIAVFLTLSLSVALLPTQQALAQNSVHVDDDNIAGPWDGTESYPYQNIQDAIDAASSGDTVKVTVGTYYDHITLKGGVVVQGAGENVTTIDGSGSGSVVTGVDNSTISGFTITGGIYGIGNLSASPTIINNIITGNTRDGIYNSGASPTIINNIISGNAGSGIYNAFSSSTILNNTIIYNKDGIRTYGSPVPSITNNIITHNITFGLFNRGNPAWGTLKGYSHITTSHNNIYGSGDENYKEEGGGWASRTPVNDVSLPPEFVDAVGADYHLQAGSPCIDAGDNASVLSWLTTDFDGDPRIMDGNGDGNAVVDMGAYEYFVSNQPPELAPIGPKSIDEGMLLEFTISASDPDGGTLSLSATGLPTSATFTDNGNNTGTFSWTPTELQGSGSHDVTFTVTDNGVPILSDSEVITITVNEVNEPPTINAPSSSQNIKEGGNPVGNPTTYLPLTFTVKASDPDIPANTLKIYPDNLPDGANLTDNGDGTANFNWVPDYNAYENAPKGDGIYIVTFSVWDGSLSDSKDVGIIVEDEPYGATDVVDADIGGTVSNSGETDVNGDGIPDPTVEIEIPSGALGEDTEINMEPHSEYVLGEGYGTYIEPIQYDFGPEGTIFDEPVEIRFYFGHIDPIHYDYWEESLTVFIWNEESLVWDDIRYPPHNTTIYYDHVYDDLQPYIYFYTDHFSVYSVVVVPIEQISEYIQDLPEGSFNKNAEQRKQALENKLDAVKNQIQAGAFQGANNKLLNDIRAKMDGESNDWIVSGSAQETLRTMIDTLVAHLEYLKTHG
ncbi:right-handed parallel beta-helix repeat-containing protein [Chloroflexota bacterium]